MGKAAQLAAVMLTAALWLAGPAGAETAVPSGPPGAALTDARAKQLDSLFARLQSGADADRRIERAILEIWHTSGDDDIDRMLQLSMVAMNRQAYQLALRYLDVIVAMKPDFVEGWNKRATVYYLIDQYDRSMADIERTLALEPRHFGALAGIGMIMVKLDDKRGAIAAFRRALAVNPHLESLAGAIRDLEAAISRDL